MRKPWQKRAHDQTHIRGNDGDVFVWVRMGNWRKNKAWLKPDTRRHVMIGQFVVCLGRYVTSSGWLLAPSKEAFHGQRKEILVARMILLPVV